MSYWPPLENSCPPPVTIFAGLTTAQLQAALTQLQTAYINLVSGQLGESYTYTQGDGSKSVTYTRGNLAYMTETIRQLQAMLGMRPTRRRPIKFWF